MCSHVEDFQARNKCLTAKIIKQVFGNTKLDSFFLNFIADTMNWFQISTSD